ncbi:hypothetical protein PENTCL1PPCAC_4200, partial [Pristionchus entomophagus]
GHSCIRFSTSGIPLEYCTLIVGRVRCITLILAIHLSISPLLFSALSSFFIGTISGSACFWRASLTVVLICMSTMTGSLCFVAGSS